MHKVRDAGCGVRCGVREKRQEWLSQEKGYNDRAKVGHVGSRGVYGGDKKQGNGSDKGEFDGQVNALVFPTFYAGGQRCAMAHGDGSASVMELEAADEGSDERLVLEQRKLHADADSWTFREGEEAAPAAAHLVYRGDPAFVRCAVLGFGGIATTDEPARGTEDVGITKDFFVAVNTDRGNVDDLALLDRNRLDP